MKKIMRRKGISFFMVLSLLSVVFLICSFLLVMVMNDIFGVRNIKYGAQAYFLAEAGAEKTIKELMADFDGYAAPGSSTDLGDGAYAVSIDTDDTDDNLKLVTSTGTVEGISRTIRVQLYHTVIIAFDYSALGSGKLTIGGGASEANPTLITSETGADVAVHSNSNANNDAVEVGVGSGTGAGYAEVTGNVSACGGVQIGIQPGGDHDVMGEITGTTTEGVSLVLAPPFGDSFFQYYYDLADADGTVYNENKEFTSDPCADTTNKVVYVNGNVNMNGEWAMTGCVVATGYIYLNKTNDHTAKTITINQHENLPALMSKHGNIGINDPAEIHGMIYANGWIILSSRNVGSITTYGVLHSKNYVSVDSQATIYYIRPNPPGLGIDAEVTILNWMAD